MESLPMQDRPFVQQCIVDGTLEKIAPYFLQRWLNQRVPLEEYTDAIDLLCEHRRMEDAHNICCRALEVWPGMPALTRRFELTCSQPAPHYAPMLQEEIFARLKAATTVLPDLHSLIQLKNIQLWLGECCNYRCWHCWYAQSTWKESSSRKHFVPLETLKTRLAEVESLLQGMESATDYRYPRSELCIESIIVGESMLHPRFSEIVNLIAEHDFAFSLNTNASLMHGKNLEALLRAHTKAVSVSLDAATPDLYARFRKGGNLNRVLANIDKFLEGAARKRTCPQLVVSFCVTPHNAHELHDFVRFWADKADCIQVQKYAGNEVTAQDMQEQLPLEQREPCAALAASLQLRADGAVYSCTCGHAELGTLQSCSLQEMFLSSERIKLIAAHTSKDYATLPKVCRQCTYWGAIQHGSTGQLVIGNRLVKCVRYKGSTCIYPRHALPQGVPTWALEEPGVFPLPPQVDRGL